MYSGRLSPADWSVKHQPKPGSAMTSFCETTNAGYLKLRDGMILCLELAAYIDFFAS